MARVRGARLRCFLGKHASFVPPTGSRDSVRCFYCDQPLRPLLVPEIPACVVCGQPAKGYLNDPLCEADWNTRYGTWKVIDFDAEVFHMWWTARVTREPDLQVAYEICQLHGDERWVFHGHGIEIAYVYDPRSA